MALIEKQLIGPDKDLVRSAIDRIKEFEQFALQMDPLGYYVAFSGGKDSIVTLDLVRRSGVKHDAHFNVTTVDPPELMQFIRNNYPDVIRHRPEKSMWQLIREKMMPPTRIVRYCCEHLKEGGGAGRFVVTGVRWQESSRRAKRRMVESCYRDKTKHYLNPIIEWTDAEVWEYIRERKLNYCCLYDEGFQRIGCVGCPMAGRNGRLKEFARWPGFERSYRRAFAAAAANIERLGPEYEISRKAGRALRWDSGDSMFDWWMQNKHEVEDEKQPLLFEA